jgi:hypothetical protein
MNKVVVPKMKPLFQSFDAKKFAEFNCKTCHGEDAKDRKFKMPAPSIFALPDTPAGFGALMKEKPEWVKFMGEQVKPQMAALLGVKEMDPKKPEPGTFGCYACHPVKGK